MKTMQNMLVEKYHSFVRHDGLKARVFRGGIWLGGASFVEQAIRFGRNMLLTRLLAPEAFGAMAIVQTATTLIQYSVDVGAREALIQNPKGEDESHVNAAWWMTMSRASLIYALTFLFAPLIAKIYGNTEFVALARLVTLSVVFDGALSPRAYVAIKTMKFWKWAAISNGGGIIGVLTTIVLGFFMRDVWALAVGFCSENVARCVLSYIVCPFRPRWPHFDAIRDLMKFSKGLVGIILLNMLFMRADVFVLGKLYPVAQLGLYSMAVYLIQTPIGFLINVMNQTLLPTLSKVQDDHARTNRIILKMTSATVWLGLPATLFVVFCGHSLLSIAYGDRYGVASAALALACVAALFNILNNQITQAFYAKGMPQLHRRSVALMAITVVVLVYPFAKMFGLWGAQLACLIAVIVGYLLQIERIRKVTGLRIADYWSVFPVPVLACSVVALAWAALARYAGVITNRPVPSIALGVGFCALTYLLLGVVRFHQTKEVA